MRIVFADWYRTNRSVVSGTIAVAIVLGLGFGLWGGFRVGALVAGAVVVLMGVLVLSSMTMQGTEQILDRQIAMRERDAARSRPADPPR